jgi:hypothetical protein
MKNDEGQAGEKTCSARSGRESTGLPRAGADIRAALREAVLLALAAARGPADGMARGKSPVNIQKQKKQPAPNAGAGCFFCDV